MPSVRAERATQPAHANHWARVWPRCCVWPRADQCLDLLERLGSSLSVCVLGADDADIESVQQLVEHGLLKQQLLSGLDRLLGRGRQHLEYS